MSYYLRRLVSTMLIIVLSIGIIPFTASAAGLSVYNVQASLDTTLVNSATGINYQFQVNTALASGDQVIIQLNDSYIVPSSIPVSALNLNVNSAVINNAINNVTVNNKTLTLTLNTAITAASLVNIKIDISAGIKNPSNGGVYSTSIATTKDTAPINVSLTVQSQVTQPLVNVYSNHVKKNASYDIVFYTADTTNSVLVGSNYDTITIKFPAGTVLPSTMSNANVIINGLTIDQGIISINKTNNTITLPLPKNLNIPKKTYVEVKIAKEAGIINPSISDGNYTLQAWTSKDTLAKNSSAYPIIDSMITIPQVTVSPNIVGQVGAYFINFSLSTDGQLIGNKDRIYIVFPKDTIVPTGIYSSDVLVNNVPLTYNPTVTNNPTITNDPNQRYRMELIVPTNLNSGQQVNIQIKPHTNIVHPSTPGNYNLEVWTSQDLEKNTSAAYTVSAAITGLTAWVSPDIAGQVGQYTIAVENGANTLLVNDQITIRFPEGTVLTNPNIKSSIFIDGVAFTGTVIVNQTDRTITLNLANAINPNQIVNILIGQTAGINNPLKQSNYFLEVKTTRDPAYKASNTFLIRGNHIVNLSAQLNNNGVNLYGEYLIQFKTSSLGGLLGGLDTVTIIFPKGTFLPYSVALNSIQINDKILDANAYISQTNRSMMIKVPKDVNITQNGNVKINILSTANIKNPSTVGSYNLLVYTSRDPVGIDSPSYHIGKQIMAPTVLISPTTYQSSAQYAIGFYTSDQGALAQAANDYVDVFFPTGTYVPAYIAPSYVTINGKTSNSTQVYDKQYLRIFFPQNMSIANSGYVGIVISSSAGIRNPTGGTYQLKIRTSKDTSFVTSQSYSTTGTAPSTGTTSSPTSSGSTSSTNTTDAAASVELSSNLIGDTSDYIIKYKTSSNGALTGGLDELIVVFDNAVQLPDTINRDLITVNDVPINNGWIRRFNRSVIFHLPSTVDVNNNSWITIKIDNKAGIFNPNKEGDYQLYIKTTKDTNPAYAKYSIVGEQSYRFNVTPEYDKDNYITKYTMTYKLEKSLTGGYDYITMMTPTSHTLDLLNNISLGINGTDVEIKNMEVSAKNLSFLVPAYLNFNANDQITITINDNKHDIMPNIIGNFVFYFTTSKEQKWIASNPVQVKAIDKTKTDGSTSQTDTQNTNQTDSSQSSGETTSSSSNQTGSTSSSSSQTTSDGTTQTSTTDTPKTNILLTLNKKIAIVNGEPKTLTAPPTVIDRNTMIPMRFVAEGMGGQVEYRPDQKRIILIYNNNYLILTIDSPNVYTINSVEHLPVAPTVVDGHTLVPLRFIADWMHLYTEYNGKDKTILLKN